MVTSPIWVALTPGSFWAGLHASVVGVSNRVFLLGFPGFPGFPVAPSGRAPAKNELGWKVLAMAMGHGSRVVDTPDDMIVYLTIYEKLVGSN